MSNDVPVVRSVVSVAAGFFAFMVLGAAADMVLSSTSPGNLEAVRHSNDTSALLVQLAYETAFALVSGYITARIAVRKPFLHVLVMSAIIFAGRAFIAALAWNATPAWLNVGVLVLLVPAALLGAKLSEWRNRSAA